MSSVNSVRPVHPVPLDLIILIIRLEGYNPYRKTQIFHSILPKFWARVPPQAGAEQIVSEATVVGKVSGKTMVTKENMVTVTKATTVTKAITVTIVKMLTMATEVTAVVKVTMVNKVNMVNKPNMVADLTDAK